MYFETWKFYRVVYGLVILSCCMIRANNGNTNTSIALTSNILKILSGIQKEARANPLISIFNVNIGNGPFNLNIPLNFSGSNTNATELEKPIKTVTKPVEIVTESVQAVIRPVGIVSEPVQTVTEPIENVSEPIETVTEPTLSSPEDYVLTEGIGYHKLYKTRRNWHDARKACKAENADLAVINSAEERYVLAQLLSNNGNADMAYIGLYYDESIGWLTVTGLSPEDAGFNLPSPWWNIPSNSRCIVFDTDLKMQHCDCSDKYYYICEIPL